MSTAPLLLGGGRSENRGRRDEVFVSHSCEVCASEFKLDYTVPVKMRMLRPSLFSRSSTWLRLVAMSNYGEFTVLFLMFLESILYDDQLSSASEREQSTSCGQPFYQKKLSDPLFSYTFMIFY